MVNSPSPSPDFPAASPISPPISSASAMPAEEYELLDVETVQRVLGRSRASIYRYAHTDPKGETLNLPFDPHHLNPEHRRDFQEPLLFHANEVARFARDVLRIREVTVEMLETPHSQTQRLLVSILEELQQIRTLLEKQQS
ncbi:MAG: resolvase [Prochlorothrix sp.]